MLWYIFIVSPFWLFEGMWCVFLLGRCVCAHVLVFIQKYAQGKNMLSFSTIKWNEIKTEKMIVFHDYAYEVHNTIISSGHRYVSHVPMFLIKMYSFQRNKFRCNCFSCRSVEIAAFPFSDSAQEEPLISDTIASPARHPPSPHRLHRPKTNLA